MDPHLPVLILFLLFLCLDGILFGFGAAIQNLNEKELEHSLEEGDAASGKLLRIANRPGRFIITLQLTVLLTGLILGACLTARPAELLAERCFSALAPAAGLLLARILLFLVTAVLTVSVGVVFPKRLALRDPEDWAFRFLGTVDLLLAVLAPLRVPVQWISGLFMRFSGIDPDSTDESVTEEDIMSMVNEGHEQGVVEEDEAEMITNIFKLNDKHASDVMTHRKNVIAISADMTLSEAVDFILKQGTNSRFPVYREDIDDIIGILHMRDAMVYAHQGKDLDKRMSEIAGLLREAHFIPETRALDTLFNEMQSRKIHMEIVIDEYGQTAGIVTMEDILEEIVGNIVDEYDRDEEMISALPDGTWIMKGMTPLEDASEVAGIAFTEEERENFDTLNGFLIAALDRIPENGDRSVVYAHGFSFRILNVQNRMIRSVKVTWEEKKQAETGKPGAEAAASRGAGPEEPGESGGKPGGSGPRGSG